MNYKEQYNIWLNSDYIDEGTKNELKKIKNEKEIEDRFYKSLKFGTGGLRGIIGAGTNRMNIYTVRKATQGIANFIKRNYKKNLSVAIAFDSRIMSKEFAKVASEVFAANEIQVNIYKDIKPTPMLSFAVGKLKCKIGISITASHNPKEYNGYKVYGEDGGQITDELAKDILCCIEKVDILKGIKALEFNSGLEKGIINYIKDSVEEEYFNKVKELVIRKDLVKNNAKDLKIIYTPLHGTGNIPIRTVLKELGFEDLYVVKEQEIPDGTFPTAPYPNPEIKDVFNIALDMAKDIKPDIILGTDPDCDRIGVVVKDNYNNYRVLSGNQTGALLTNYILMSLKEKNKLPENGVVIKTIVTTDIVKKIGEKFKIPIIEVLTGFKYIGEKIKEFQKDDTSKYIFGFEESYGYLAGNFVRDKDAVIASALICEMTLYYKSIGLSLYEALIKLYDEYGYYKEELLSVELKGKEGQEKIEKAMHYLRHSMSTTLNDVKIYKKLDYKLSIEKNLFVISEHHIELPKSNVLKFIFNDGSWFVVRPSGTEPKIKIYLSVIGNNKKHAEDKIKMLKKSVKDIIDVACNC
ncbi:phospho-sugar mutase [Clostridium rectalis]|uniref:phospho-sugar mutase n=1 Tax=Clostridium rectalis TaxID=2040295 RepID=UPI000F62D541|nr:phospho-sugar mutase [Clostridium rectalis]